MNPRNLVNPRKLLVFFLILSFTFTSMAYSGNKISIVNASTSSPILGSGISFTSTGNHLSRKSFGIKDYVPSIGNAVPVQFCKSRPEFVVVKTVKFRSVTDSDVPSRLHFLNTSWAALKVFLTRLDTGIHLSRNSFGIKDCMPSIDNMVPVQFRKSRPEFVVVFFCNVKTVEFRSVTDSDFPSRLHFLNISWAVLKVFLTRLDTGIHLTRNSFGIKDCMPSIDNAVPVQFHKSRHVFFCNKIVEFRSLTLSISIVNVSTSSPIFTRGTSWTLLTRNPLLDWNVSPSSRNKTTLQNFTRPLHFLNPSGISFTSWTLLTRNPLLETDIHPVEEIDLIPTTYNPQDVRDNIRFRKSLGHVFVFVFVFVFGVVVLFVYTSIVTRRLSYRMGRAPNSSRIFGTVYKASAAVKRSECCSFGQVFRGNNSNLVDADFSYQLDHNIICPNMDNFDEMPAVDNNYDVNTSIPLLTDSKSKTRKQKRSTNVGPKASGLSVGYYM